MTIFLFDKYLIHHRRHHFVIIASFGFLFSMTLTYRVPWPWPWPHDSSLWLWHWYLKTLALTSWLKSLALALILEDLGLDLVTSVLVLGFGFQVLVNITDYDAGCLTKNALIQSHLCSSVLLMNNHQTTVSTAAVQVQVWISLLMYSCLC